MLFTYCYHELLHLTGPGTETGANLVPTSHIVDHLVAATTTFRAMGHITILLLYSLQFLAAGWNLEACTQP